MLLLRRFRFRLLLSLSGSSTAQMKFFVLAFKIILMIVVGGMPAIRILSSCFKMLEVYRSHQVRWIWVRCAKPLQWNYLCLNAFWRHYGLCAGVRSILKKTIYDIAAAIRIPSLKDWPRSYSDGVYIPLEPEKEIKIEQNPASSTVGVCNSVSFVPLMHRPPPYCVLPYFEHIFPWFMQMNLAYFAWSSSLIPSAVAGLSENNWSTCGRLPLHQKRMRHKLPECVLLFDRLVSVHFNSSKHRIMHRLMLHCRNPAPDLPPLYSSSYACSVAALNLQQNYRNTSVIAHKSLQVQQLAADSQRIILPGMQRRVLGTSDWFLLWEAAVQP